jgi:hypothetical protein
MAKATIDTNNFCLQDGTFGVPQAVKVDQVPVTVTVLLGDEAEAKGLAQVRGGLGPVGAGTVAKRPEKIDPAVTDANLKQAAEGQGGPRSSRGQFPNGRADTAGKGGSFGNEHSNSNYPDADTGD